MRSKEKNILLLISALALFLSGCGAMVVGGAAGGGYYVGQDERTAGQIATDARITTEINTRFVRDADISALKIDVDTVSGVVTLTGSVPDAASRERAVRLSRSVDGVRRVISHLKVK